MDEANIDYLTAKDEVKFVIADREDYQYTKEIIAKEYIRPNASAVGRLIPRRTCTPCYSRGCIPYPVI